MTAAHSVEKASVDYLEDENNDRIKSILALLDVCVSPFLKSE